MCRHLRSRIQIVLRTLDKMSWPYIFLSSMERMQSVPTTWTRFPNLGQKVTGFGVFYSGRAKTLPYTSTGATIVERVYLEGVFTKRESSGRVEAEIEEFV